MSKSVDVTLDLIDGNLYSGAEEQIDNVLIERTIMAKLTVVIVKAVNSHFKLIRLKRPLRVARSQPPKT